MYIFMYKVPNRDHPQSYRAYSTENYLYDYLKTERKCVYLLCYALLLILFIFFAC